jgi:hypothetical protein
LRFQVRVKNRNKVNRLEGEGNDYSDAIDHKLTLSVPKVGGIGSEQSHAEPGD